MQVFFKGWLVHTYYSSAPVEDARSIFYYDSLSEALEKAQGFAEDEGDLEVAVYQLVEIIQGVCPPSEKGGAPKFRWRK